ncbi:hypothetical protein AB2N08_20895 [Massilia aurea]|uniref:hypothetical protein n=1 Tax=Massilia aurea TaxID=373040 RepID=UPI003462CFB7
MQHVSLWLGIALVVIGCFMLAHTNAHAGSNEIRLLGMIFKVSHPALVIIVLGFVLVILNDHRSSSLDIPDAFLLPEAPVAPETTVPAPVGSVTDETTATNVAPTTPGADTAIPSERPASQVEPRAAQAAQSVTEPNGHLPALPQTSTPAAEDLSTAATAAADAAAAAFATELDAAAAEKTGSTPAPMPSRQIQ